MQVLLACVLPCLLCSTAELYTSCWHATQVVLACALPLLFCLLCTTAELYASYWRATQMVLACALPLLFCLLGSTAELYTSCWCAMQVVLACVLPLLFCLLGSTAELYFSPTMSLVSQTIPKMRPRFAGGKQAPPLPGPCMRFALIDQHAIRLADTHLKNRWCVELIGRGG